MQGQQLALPRGIEREVSSSLHFTEIGRKKIDQKKLGVTAPDWHMTEALATMVRADGPRPPDAWHEDEPLVTEGDADGKADAALDVHDVEETRNHRRRPGAKALFLQKLFDRA